MVDRLDQGDTPPDREQDVPPNPDAEYHPWIMKAVIDVGDRIDGLGKRLDKMEDKIDWIRRNMWIVFGVGIAIAAIASLAFTLFEFPKFTISISQHSG